MKKFVLIALNLFGILLAIAITFIVVGLVATRVTTLTSGPLVVEITGKLAPAGAQLTLLSWNLGYGGLGADADFVADGGKGVLPKSLETVAAHLSGFRQTIEANPSDVVLVQEVATSSPLNYGADVLSAIQSAIPERATVYSIDVATRLLPPPLKVEHGKAIISRVAMSGAERNALPLEDSFILGVLRHNYSAVVARFPIHGSTRSWVLLNVHFAAFDAGGEVRRKQLQEALAIAQREYAKGNPVVVAGDFNMEFIRDAFPSTEDKGHRFWIRDFPTNLLPRGWKVAYGTNAPSVRTLAAPYVAGITYTTVVDGFILSPGVTVQDVRVIDTKFAYSDHQPTFVTVKTVD